MIAVRRAGLADADALADLHAAGWREGYAGLLPAPYLASITAQDKKPLWLYVFSERAAAATVLIAGAFDGFVWAGPAHEPTLGCSAEIYALYVRAARWRRGVGRALMAAAAGSLGREGHQRLVLWTLTDNPRSNHFYSALGGAPAEKRFDCYGGETKELTAYIWSDLTDLIPPGHIHRG